MAQLLPEPGVYHRTGIAAASGSLSPKATAVDHQDAEPPSKPQIPFFTGSKTASSSSSPAKPSASTLADNNASQLSSRKSSASAPSAHPSQQVIGPVGHMPASRPQSSSCQHQLHDLGFEDVDLDSPDASISIKTRSDDSQPANRSHIMPIPFMEQHNSQDKASSSVLQPDDFDLTDSASPSLQQSEANTSYPLAPPVEGISAGLTLPASAVHVTMDENQLQHGSDSYESTRGSTPADLAEEPSVPAAGPFSSYPSPGSTSSSTPASPGAGAGAPPTRRSSFLPRGMSSHLHKALKATAAAASKASAAIAPPPNAPLPPSSWQEAARPQVSALSLPMPKEEQDPEFPFQQPWSPSGPASPSSQGRKENGKPWWQQQLRNLQQNLHSQQQQPSDAALDADAGTAPETSQSLLNSPFHTRLTLPVSENGDIDDSNGRQPDSVLTSTASFPPPAESMPPPLRLQPWSPHRASLEHSSLSADSSHQQMELDSMRIMESLGEGDSMEVSQKQPAASASAANSKPLDGQGTEQDYPTESSLLDAGPDATADSQVEVRLLQSTLISREHL